MAHYSTLMTDGSPSRAVAGLLRGLLEKEVVRAVLSPERQKAPGVVMQTLVSDPAALSDIDPLAPVVTTSAAKLLASLSWRPTGVSTAVVVRSCELRAFVELVKLKQGSLDDLLVVGVDCFGRYENRDYLAVAAASDDPALTFLRSAQNGGGTAASTGHDITTACKACVHPTVEGADLRVALIGADPAETIWVEAGSDKGEAALDALGLEVCEGAPAGRAAAVEALRERRQAFREAQFAEFTKKTNTPEGLADAVASCINCYNCRVACPVCYCRECVFVTDTFRHPSEKYLRWADGRGAVKLPTDTAFYHLTRMLHMSTLCVGCGQCTSACPNDIPVMELIATTAERTQARFDYVPGRSVEEGQPLSVFYAEEFDDVTGQVK